MSQPPPPPTKPPVSPPFTTALLAGALAGTTVDLALYPLDTLKTRLQSSRGFHPSGGFTGIYAGVGSALIGSAPGAAFFFVSYEGVKKFLRRNRRKAAGEEGNGDGDGGGREAVEHMIAASVGEVAACAVRVPTEVVKQRAQALQAVGSMAALKGILALRTEGVGWVGVGRELYRGWGITVMREVPFTVIQFPLWEGMKRWRARGKGTKGVSAVESAVFGSLAGGVAAAVTTPLDVLKTRLMLGRERERVGGLVGRMLREEGASVFVAGMGPRVLWISAGGAIFLGSYQWACNALEGGR